MLHYQTISCLPVYQNYSLEVSSCWLSPHSLLTHVCHFARNYVYKTMLRTARLLPPVHLELHLRLIPPNLQQQVLLALKLTNRHRVASSGGERQTPPLAVVLTPLHRTINRLLSRIPESLAVLHLVSNNSRVGFQLLLNKVRHNNLSKVAYLAVVLLSETRLIGPLLVVLLTHLGTVGLYRSIDLQILTALVPSNANRKCFWYHEPRNQRIWPVEPACPTTTTAAAATTTTTTSQRFWWPTARRHARQFWDRNTW